MIELENILNAKLSEEYLLENLSEMNIFVLSLSPTLAAQYQCDKHVVKMVLESTQILSTVQSKFGVQTKYKPTHANHPCTIWAGESICNYDWLLTHAKALSDEYTYRYGKIHACKELIDGVLSIVPSINKLENTPFVQAMPEHYKIPDDPVQAYRDYYIGEKGSFAQWNKARKAPEWWIQL